MKTIYDFKKGDKIVRVEPSKEYSSGVRDRSYMGEELIFMGVANGQIYCQRTSDFAKNVFGDKPLSLALDMWDQGWDFYFDPFFS